MRNNIRRCARMVLALLASSLVCADATAAVQVIGVQYQQDQTYPEWKCFWHDDCHIDVVGGNVHVYVKNTGGASVTISDVTLAGHSLKTVIKNDPTTEANSIFFYWNDPPADILNAGDPAWFKGDPTVIPPGGVAQAVMHLRSVPTTPTVSVGVVTTGGTVTTNVPIDASAPQLVSVGFSTNRAKVYLHWRRSNGTVPTTIKLDGVDVTAITRTVNDPTVNFGVSVIHLAQPLDYMSYHVFQGVYADGKMATASLRAWSHPFLYATWGTFPYADDNTANAQAWITEATQHGFNAAQNQGIGGALGDYLRTSAGKAYAAARGGYGFIIWQTGASDDPLMSFLEDEPDATEARLENRNCGNGLQLPCGKSPMGVLAMREIAEGETYRALHPLSPTTLNVDGSWRPLNYITWAHTVDVIQVDPYYQMRLQDAYDQIPSQIPLYLKATVVYAITKATVTGAEPNPAHPILFSTELLSGGEVVWPFPNRESKRIEVYYALAAGAKGLSYWWMNPGPKFNGMGNQNKPESRALWKEMGLLGNEIKTVGPLIVTSHPVDMPITPGPNVWARALASGDDTIVLIVVNDNYYNDDSWKNGNGQTGFHSTDVANATVTATLPAWMQSPMAFEVTPGGLKSVSTQPTNGNQLQINLGTLQLTRMIVLTKNPEVPLLTQQRYDQQVRWGITNIAPEFSTNSAPVIVVQPQSQVVLVNSNATFVVTATGIPAPTYEWRYNGANLAGATAASYTRANAQVSHNGGYSVVVSNSLGSVTSAVANLTVSTNGYPPSILTPPSSQSVEVGDNATFSVTASGTEPLSYQWRFNGGNLSGATATSYTRNNAQVTDAGSYDVVVANTAGSITSAPATLTVTIPCPPASLLNASFEGGTNANGVAANWIGYQRAPNPTTLWSIQVANPPAGAGTHYQQIANTSSTGGGGVRQNIDGCIIGATYTISGWMRGNSASATCTVKCSPSASTDWATAMDLDPPQTYSGPDWTPFSGTVVATGITMTLWLDGQTGGSGLNKAECFDAITITCALAGGIPPNITQQPSNQSVGVGGVASFTVLAGGAEPLSYQWQKNTVNLNNGGHYSGVLTATLNITGADTNNAGNYRCVVTNAYGVTYSSPAALTLVIPNPCVGIQNSDFESGFSLAGGGYIANDWTEWEAEPGVVLGYDETSIVHGGGHAQRIRVWGDLNGTSGGVYQRVTVTAGQPYLVAVWMYAGDNLTSCSLGVDPTGGTDPNSGVTWSSGTTNVEWVQKTWAGTSGADYITVYCRVSSQDDVKRNGYFDDAGPTNAAGPLQLLVQGDGASLTLTWPECPAARLEQTSSLSLPITWTTVTNQVTVAGGEKSVTLTPTGNAGYYRLVLE